MPELFLWALFPFQTGSKESSSLSLKLFTRPPCVCISSCAPLEGQRLGVEVRSIAGAWKGAGIETLLFPWDLSYRKEMGRGKSPGLHKNAR